MFSKEIVLFSIHNRIPIVFPFKQEQSLTKWLIFAFIPFESCNIPKLDFDFYDSPTSID